MERKWLVNQTIGIAFIVLIAILIIIGIVGNSIIIIIYWKRPRSSSQFLILILGLSDLTSCIFLMPLSIFYVTNNLSNFFRIYIFDSALHLILIFNILVFIVIAFDRYFALAKPFSSILSYKIAKQFMILGVFISIAFTALLKYLRIKHTYVYKILILTFFFTLSLILTIIYILAFVSVTINLNRIRKKRVVDADSTSPNITANRYRNNSKNIIEAVKTAKMLFFVTYLFIIVYIPFVLLDMIPIKIKEALQFTYFINNISNIFIYLLFSYTFRKDCKKVLEHF